MELSISMTTDVCPRPRSKADILPWLVAKLVEQARVALDQVDIEEHFSSYGLDSVAGVNFAADLEDDLGIEIPATALWDNSTLSDLARYLEGRLFPERGA